MNRSSSDRIRSVQLSKVMVWTPRNIHPFMFRLSKVLKTWPLRSQIVVVSQMGYDSPQHDDWPVRGLVSLKKPSCLIKIRQVRDWVLSTEEEFISWVECRARRLVTKERRISRFYSINVCLGGVPRSKLSQLFNYTYSTAPKPQSESGADAKAGPIAGLGYGLPIARLYARYFQGNLVLSSVEGLGTWAYVSIKVRDTFLFYSLCVSFFFFFFSLSLLRPRQRMRGKHWSMFISIDVHCLYSSDSLANYCPYLVNYDIHTQPRRVLIGRHTELSFSHY